MAVKLMPLETVAKIYSGSSLKNRQNVFGESGCPWVKVEDLNNGEMEKSSRSLSWEGMKQVKVSPAQTVFFSSTGTIGKVGITKVPMAPSNNMIAVEFHKDQIEPLYGMYCLLAMGEELRAEAGGSVYASLRLSTFRKFQIPVPSLSEQHKIAAKLAALRKSYQEQASLISKIKQAVHVLFDSYFGQNIESMAQKQNCLQLGDFAEITLNGAAKKKSKQKVRYVATAQLRDWEILQEHIPLEETEQGLTNRYDLIAGDIVMNRINSAERLGKCGLIFTEPEEKTVFGKNTFRIRANCHILNPLFLFAWLTHPYIKQYILGNAKNSTSFQSSLNKQVLWDIPLPKVHLEQQEEYSEKLKHYFSYIRTAEKIMETLNELQQVWYDKIRFSLQQEEEEQKHTDDSAGYQEGRYWTAPTKVICFYDSFLECIQVPPTESGAVRLFQLPLGAEVQFLDEVRTADQKNYGCLEHIRLRRISENTMQIIHMEPVDYRTWERQEREGKEGQPEENGILSEQQDFGYIRHIKEITFGESETAKQCLLKYSQCSEEGYCRFQQFPDAARFFVSRLSKFQQAVFEEFLLAMQPLACHMVGRQVAVRSGNSPFENYGIQDVSAAVRLLEHAGLLEKRQGLYLNYDKDYRQGETRQMILDHRGKPIPIDTWICGDVKEQGIQDAVDKGMD